MKNKIIQISEWTPDMEPREEPDPDTEDMVYSMIESETRGFGTNKNTNNIPEFIRSAHVLFSTIRLENKEVISLNEKYGTIHFCAICDPNHVKSFKTGLQLFCKAVTDLILWKKNNLFVPNFLHYGHNMATYDGLVSKTKVRMLSESIREVQWIGQDGTTVNLDPIQFESVFREIQPDAADLLVLLNETHFTMNGLRKAERIISHAINLLTIIRNTITPEAVAGWLNTDQDLPSGMERLD